MPMPEMLDLSVNLSAGRTHQRIRWGEFESRLKKYIIDDFASSIDVSPVFPEIQTILQLLEVPKASFMRHFSSAISFKIWAFKVLIEHVDLYATDKICAEIVAVPSDVHTRPLSNKTFLTRVRRSIVTSTDHARAIRVEQAVASLGNDKEKESLSQLMLSAQFAHVSAIGLRLEGGHKWFREGITGDDAGGYATALFDAARGFALSPFGPPTEDVQEAVFSSIAAHYVRPL